MITASKIENSLLNEVSNLSVMNQLVQTIFVDSNIANIEQVIVEKADGLIKNTKFNKEVKLKKHKIILKIDNDNVLVISDEINISKTLNNCSLSSSISSRIDRDFISKMNSLSNLEVEKWKYFNRNIIMSILNKRTKNDLVNKIIEIGYNFNWIIISKNIFDILKTSNYFHINKDNSQLISNVGNIRMDNSNFNVYLCNCIPDNIIYFGKNDSVSIVMNKNINIEESRSSTKDKKTILIDIEYEFINNGLIKILNI